MTKMEKSIMVIAAIAGLLGASGAVAQPENGAAKYDPKTVEVIEVRVLSVEKTAPTQNRDYEIYLIVHTADNEAIPVHLGPASYVDKQTPHIEANDVVIVTGSQVTIGGKPAIIAAVMKGTDVLTLRNKNGVPAWSGGGGPLGLHDYGRPLKIPLFN